MRLVIIIQGSLIIPFGIVSFTATGNNQNDSGNNNKICKVPFDHGIGRLARVWTDGHFALRITVW